MCVVVVSFGLLFGKCWFTAVVCRCPLFDVCGLLLSLCDVVRCWLLVVVVFLCVCLWLVFPVCLWLFGGVLVRCVS